MISNLSQTKIKITAIIAVTAILLLIGIIVFFVTINFTSQSKLRKFALDQIRSDIEKRAASVSYFFSERRNDLNDFALSKEISAFFENKALGMSMEYGLKASLLEMSEKFGHLLKGRKINNDHIYTGIFFIDNEGKLLVKKYLKNPGLIQILDYRELLTPKTLEAFVILRHKHDKEKLQIIVSIPYFFKNKYMGQIIAIVNFSAISNFIEVSKKNSRRSIYIVCSKHYTPLNIDKDYLWPFSNVPNFDNLKNGITQRFRLDSKNGNKIDMAVIKTKVQDTPFSMIAFIPSSELYSAVPSWYLPLVMGVLAIILLGGIVITFQISRQATQELKESENFFKDISYSMADWIWELDKDRKYTFASESIKQILGYSPKRIIGKEPFDFMTEEEAKGIKKIFKSIYSMKKPIVDLENWKLTKDGEKVCILTNGVPVFDKNGKLIGYRGVDKNITDRKLAEAEKERLEIQLKHAQKMEAIGTLAGGVAHDLNNILISLVGYPDLLLMDIEQDSPLRIPLLTIKKSGEKAAAIVQDLLTLARRGVSVKEIVNLNHVIYEYLKSLEYKKLKQLHPQINFNVKLDKKLLNIKGSSIHLSKIVMNLVTNAAESISDKGEISIITENQHIDTLIKGYENIGEGDYVTLSILDTGIGISQADKQRIFEPFYTKKVMDQKSGTGLGMSVVWGSIKDHRGYIDIQSNEGEGTKFKLYFPVSREKYKMDKLTITKKNYMGRGESILIVDDVEEQRELLSKILNRLGYSPSAVESGEKAVDYIKKTSVDLLILDMIMGEGIDGLETYKRILELKPGQKAIIASGFSKTNRVKEALRLGAGVYVQKPYSLEEVDLAVRVELDKKI